MPLQLVETDFAHPRSYSQPAAKQLVNSFSTRRAYWPYYSTTLGQIVLTPAIKFLLDDQQFGSFANFTSSTPCPILFDNPLTQAARLVKQKHEQCGTYPHCKYKKGHNDA